MKKLKKDELIKKPLWFKIKDKWQDETFRKRADNYLFFGFLAILIIFGAFKTLSLRNNQSVMKLKEAVAVLSEQSLEENPQFKDAQYKTKEEKYLTAVDKLNTVINKNKLTKGGKLAKFYKAVALIELKKYDDAVTILEEYREKNKNDLMLPLAYLNLGAAYEYSKDFEKAEATYKNGLGRFKDTNYEPYFAYYLFLIYEVENKMDAAKQLAENYKDFKSDALILKDLNFKVNYFLSL
jgi:predicted negative regulator of RcsB-dependent stress response